MTENVVVARFYTEDEALLTCDKLRNSGVQFHYSAPPVTGNYIVDWNISTPEYLISVPESELATADKVLVQMENDWDAQAEDGRSTPEMETCDPDDEIPVSELPGSITYRSKKALKFAVVCWLVPILFPFSLWRSATLLFLAQNEKEVHRLFLAILIAVLCPLCWWMAFSVI